MKRQAAFYIFLHIYVCVHVTSICTIIYICIFDICIHICPYIYMLYMSNDSYLEYIKSSYKSVTRLSMQFKNGQNSYNRNYADDTQMSNEHMKKCSTSLSHQGTEN